MSVVGLYRQLLRLYPPALRDRFGPEMEATFRSAWSRATRSGRLAAVRFLFAASWDLVSSAVAERHGARYGTGRGGGLLTDVTAGLRSIRRRPGLPLLVAGTLSLGIGANTAVFSLVNAVLLDPLSVGDPGSLVVVYEARENDLHGATSWPNYSDLRSDLRSASDLAASSEIDLGLRTGTLSDRVVAGIVSGNWFGALGLAPQEGRLLQPFDEEGGGQPNVVLSHALWRRHFGGDADVVGTPIRLSGRVFTIVGVAPPEFRGTDLSVVHDLWIPVTLVQSVAGAGLFSEEFLSSRWLPVFRMVGRLRPGYTAAALEAELNTRHAPLREQHEELAAMDYLVPAIHTLPIRRAATAERRAEVVRFLTVPAGVALVTLLIACLNVALLLLVRASERGREFGIRVALGAGRTRLVRQVLAESVAIGALGCIAGITVALGTLALLRGFPLPGRIAMDALPLLPDARVLGFGVGVSAVTALLFGSVPAWAASRPHVVESLRGSTRNARREAGIARLALLAGQVALCLALLVGAGLFLRSLRAALDLELGIDAGGVAGASFSLRPHGYDDASAADFFRQVIEATAAAPGIDAAAIAVHVPIEPRRLRMPVSNEVIPSGTGRFVPGTATISVNIVSGDYFETLGIALLEGRTFTAADAPDAPEVAVLSRSAAALLWPGEDAIGREFQLVRGVGPGRRVIGIVDDVTAHAVQEGPVPYVYVSAIQEPQIQALENATLLARDGADGRVALQAIRNVLAARDPTLPVFRERRVADQIADVLVPQRLAVTLLAIFGGIALLVAAVGIYGVVSWAVTRRHFEIGLRRALGARPLDVLDAVTRPTLLALGIGAAAGLVGAAWLTGFVESWLFGITPLDPVAYLAAAALLTLTALAATLLPARRAVRVSPLTAMRTQE